MLGAGHLVAHIDVVGPHPRDEQPLHQQLHHLGIIVDAPEQHRLTPERNAGIGEHAERLHGGRRELVGVVEMRVDIERVVLLQDGAQLRRHALGQVTGDATPDSEHLEMRNRPQPLADLVDAAVGQQQGIPARHDDVADLRMLRQIAKRRLELRHGDLLGVAHLAPARAKAAVGRADGRDEKQRAIRIAVRDVGDRRVLVLGERVDEPVLHVELL